MTQIKERGKISTKWKKNISRNENLNPIYSNFKFALQVSAMVGNLRNMANDMGNELERQNNQVDRINLKAGSDITRVKMANDTAAQLMKWINIAKWFPIFLYIGPTFI